MLLAGYMSLYEAGKLATVKRWMKEDCMQPENSNVRLVLEARQAITEGNLHQARLYMEKMPFNRINSEVNSLIQLEAEIVKADISLLSGEKADAFRSALNAFYIHPRSRRTIYLNELCLDDPQRLSRLFHVTATIFPKQPYWQKKLQEIRSKGFEEESAMEVLSLHEDLKKGYKNFSTAKINFWVNQDPFYVEYICLRMVKMLPEEIQEEGLGLYLMLKSDMKGFSPVQTAHTRTFWRILLGHIPSEARTKWQRKFDCGDNWG